MIYLMATSNLMLIPVNCQIHSGSDATRPIPTVFNILFQHEGANYPSPSILFTY